MLTDPIGDMITRIRNAGRARHRETSCSSSRVRLAIARVLAEEGFLGTVRVEAREGKPVLVVGIRYDENGKPIIDGMRRVSRPGRRVYVGQSDVPKIRNGLGVAVVSTSKGVLSDRAAREAGVGGELLCEVW
ncbi:30S ribosomal protein S8 [Myxococcaceae bacterium]|jgi:small subunit ribosomal protein S8|nr:30S ribosomal protein S8 [Myxococcaceae bacterium]